MKARLLNVLVDLLFDCFFLLIGPDKSPGITVSTIPELAAALMQGGSGIVYTRSSKNESALLTTPVIVIDGAVIVGLDAEKIDRAVPS